MVISVLLSFEASLHLGNVIEKWLEIYKAQARQRPDYIRQMEAQLLEGCLKRLLGSYKGNKPKKIKFTQAEIDCIAKNTRLLSNHAGPALLCQ
jgi:hypothetical protein